MAGEMVHIEIPADDTAAGREFWGSLFGWKFESFPGPFEYHIARIDDRSGAAITTMEPGKKGTRTYFSVDDINAGAAVPAQDPSYHAAQRGGGSSVGRAPGCGPGGRGFESPPPPGTGETAGFPRVTAYAEGRALRWLVFGYSTEEEAARR